NRPLWVGCPPQIVANASLHQVSVDDRDYSAQPRITHHRRNFERKHRIVLPKRIEAREPSAVTQNHWNFHLFGANTQLSDLTTVVDDAEQSSPWSRSRLRPYST